MAHAITISKAELICLEPWEELIGKVNRTLCDSGELIVGVWTPEKRVELRFPEESEEAETLAHNLIPVKKGDTIGILRTDMPGRRYMVRIIERNQ
jgi:hypothetical protein